MGLELLQGHSKVPATDVQAAAIGAIVVLAVAIEAISRIAKRETTSPMAVSEREVGESERGR